MAWVGMNIAKCKHHSEELERQRVKLDKLLHLIDGEAGKIRGNWNGNDAQRFQSEWQSKHKHNVQQAISFVAKLKKQLDQEIAEQQRTSH